MPFRQNFCIYSYIFLINLKKKKKKNVVLSGLSTIIIFQLHRFCFPRTGVNQSPLWLWSFARVRGFTISHFVASYLPPEIPWSSSLVSTLLNFWGTLPLIFKLSYKMFLHIFLIFFFKWWWSSMKLDKFLRLFEHMGIFVRDQGLTFIWVLLVFEFEGDEGHVVESWNLLWFGFRFQYWDLVDLFTRIYVLLIVLRFSIGWVWGVN